MNDLSELKQILHYRMTENEDNYYYVTYWEEVEIPAFTKDIGKTIEFIKMCSLDELLWLGEIFEEIVEKTQSKEFIATLREMVQKFPDGEQKDRLIYEINWAENQTGLDEK